MDTSKPYEIHPAAEGGFCILKPFSTVEGYYRDSPLIASFTSASDLIHWLAEQHCVKIADAHELPGPSATERLVPRRVSPLEDDGTEEWTKWDGHMPPGFIKGEKCVAKLRNDTRIFTSTGENDGCDWWWKSSPAPSTVRQHAHDVVAYRPV